MANCRKCGLPLKFIQKLGREGVLKWFPMNPDGTGHWDICKVTQRQQPAYQETNVSRNSNGKTTYPIDPYTHQWIGMEPPWDESLSEFRDFTDEEKAQRMVCAPFERMRGNHVAR
jgi:hypothetical protein